MPNIITVSPFTERMRRIAKIECVRVQVQRAESADFERAVGNPSEGVLAFDEELSDGGRTAWWQEPGEQAEAILVYVDAAAKLIASEHAFAIHDVQEGGRIGSFLTQAGESYDEQLALWREDSASRPHPGDRMTSKYAQAARWMYAIVEGPEPQVMFCPHASAPLASRQRGACVSARRVVKRRILPVWNSPAAACRRRTEARKERLRGTTEDRTNAPPCRHMQRP